MEPISYLMNISLHPNWFNLFTSYNLCIERFESYRLIGRSMILPGWTNRSGTKLEPITEKMSALDIKPPLTLIISIVPNTNYIFFRLHISQMLYFKEIEKIKIKRFVVCSRTASWWIFIISLALIKWPLTTKMHYIAFSF